MKKLLTLAAMCAIVLTSCMKNEEPNPEDIAIANGQTLYNFGRPYQDYAMDPANIALKVNSLLVEAQRLGVTDLSQEIAEDGKNFKTLLFGEYAAFSGGAASEVTVSFSGATVASYVTRHGKIHINTGGKLLHEADALWTITNDASAGLFWNIDGTKFNMTWPDGNYTLMDMGGEWDLSIDGYACYYAGKEADASDWWGGFTLECSSDYLSADVPGGYDAYKATKLTIDGTSSGTRVGENITFTYSASGLKLALGCGTGFVVGGRETVKCPALSLSYPEEFPKDYVTVDWAELAACKNSATLTYNGYRRLF